MPESLPHVPITAVPAPASTNLADPTNTYPKLENLTNADSVGPQAANRQPRALDIRTETLRAAVNKLIDVVNAMDDNYLHRDGAAAGSFMRDNLSMRNTDTNTNKRIVNLASGTAANDAVNKSQLDVMSATATTLATTSILACLPRDGSRPMTGNLNANNNRVLNVGAPQAETDGVSKQYVEDRISALGDTYIRRDGSTSMSSSLNMGSQRITHLADPVNPQDAVNYGSLVSRVSAIAEIPIGAIVFTAFAGNGAFFAADGWLVCDGSEVLISEYPVLAQLLGASWGSASVASRFKVPDLRGRTVVGVDLGAAVCLQAATVGSIFGSEYHTLTTQEIAAHFHHYTDQYLAYASTNATVTGPSSTATNGSNVESVRSTASTGEGQPHQNCQPSVTVQAIIRAK